MTLSEYIQSLYAYPHRPAWAKPYDATVAKLIIERYNRRRAQRTVQRKQSWYQQYLASGHWATFRLAVLVLSGGKCCKCGDVADHVHHLHYKSLNRERLRDVEPLCEMCHANEHNVDLAMKQVGRLAEAKGKA
jgi:5-methylcytosine-specific restriction endonuclease McrA